MCYATSFASLSIHNTGDELDLDLEHFSFDTGRRTTPAKSRNTNQELAQSSVMAWLDETEERGKALRPTKIRKGWKSTSGGIAPSMVKHLVVKHLRVT
jgi:hypothetical protein